MKKISEDLNPKCEKISQQSHDYLLKVLGQAEGLAWDMHILSDSLSKDAAIGFDGHMWLQNMAARADAISDEIVNVINILESEDKTPQ